RDFAVFIDEVACPFEAVAGHLAATATAHVLRAPVDGAWAVEEGGHGKAGFVSDVALEGACLLVVIEHASRFQPLLLARQPAAEPFGEAVSFGRRHAKHREASLLTGDTKEHRWRVGLGRVAATAPQRQAAAGDARG